MIIGGNMVVSEPEYMRKLRTHKKFSEEDLEQFILNQARELGIEDYVKKVEVSYLLQAIASYSFPKKKVNIDKESQKILKKEFFDMREDKLVALKRMLVCNFNDFYNLYMIYTCLHELSHAVQYKRAEEDSFFSLLIKCSLKFMRASGSVYAAFHDKYYIEYNANINSMNLTLNFIETHFKECFGKRTLVLLNKIFVDYILDGYGVSDKKTSVNQNFSSPIDFFNFFLYHEEYSDHEPWPIETIDKPMVEKLKIFIDETYPSLMKNDISDLFNGYPIPPNVLAKLVLIKNGDIETTNFLEEVEREFEIGNKKKSY